VVRQVQENPHLRQSDFARLSLGLLKRGANFVPPVSVSETEITKMLYQYSRVIMCISTIMLLILATVWGLHTCEFLVSNKSCLLTCVSEGWQKVFHRFSSPRDTVFQFKCCRVNFLNLQPNNIRQTFFPHQIGMLGTLEEPITLAHRFCCEAKFIVSATVRRTFAHTLVVVESVALVRG